MKRLLSYLTALVVLVAVLVLPASRIQAQDDGKSFLEGWLETNLSAAGRDVRVTGFAGALSSQATLDELTISDDDGVWLTLRGVQLDWTRSALLAGRLEVDHLQAEEIELARPPLTEDDAPQATASRFSLPELPVSIEIGKVEAKRLVLGEPVLGVAAVMSLEGAAMLDAGAGQASLSVARIDGAEGTFDLSGSYANETRFLDLNLALSEGAGGIVTTLTGLAEGAPLSLTIAGSGPIEDFTAEIDLKTDGQSRLTGQVSLAADAPATDTALGFRASLTGDPSPLVSGELTRFFGTDVLLDAQGARHPDGGLDLDSVRIRTRVMDFTGSARINALGWAERAQITGTIAAPEGGPVLLPVSGGETWVERASVSFAFDSAQGPDWIGSADIQGLRREDLSLDALRLTGAGTLTPQPEGRGMASARIDGTLELEASGIAPSDPAIARAIGPRLSGRVVFSKRDQARFRLGQINLRGVDYALSGQASFGIDWKRLDVLTTGDVLLQAQDMSRFAALSGQDLSGAADLRITGAASLMRGAFDGIVDGTGRDLAVGIPAFDRTFAGESSLSFATRRDTEATEVEDFEIISTGGAASGTARLAPQDSRITARIDVTEAGVLVDGLAGSMSLNGRAVQDGDRWQVDLSTSAPGDTKAYLSGVITLGPDGPSLVDGALQADIGDLGAFSALAGRPLSGAAQLSARGQFQPTTGAANVQGSASGHDLGFGLGSYDRLTAGDSRAEFALRRVDKGVLWIDQLDLTTPELRVDLAAEDTGALSLDARLRDLGLLVPGLSGPFTADGQARQDGDTWQVDLSGAGPGGTQMTVAGRIAADGATADLDVSGTAPLALANPFIAPRQLDGLARFDLSLNGAPSLAALSGTVNLNGARAALPLLRLALDPVTGTIGIAGGRASIEATAQVSSGGRVVTSGTVGLSAPYQANLSTRVEAVGLTDPTLYDTTASGAVTLTGPLTGGALAAGRITLGVVQLRIPETGFGADGSLPDLKHIGASSAVQATRARAGLTGGGSTASGGTSLALDLEISAPDKVFLRGRGLDAELGGALRLSGTTDRIETQGGFELIRGRLDFLGNRLTLTEARATLQGSLSPYLLVEAETQVEEVAVLVKVEGPANEPEVSFTSVPDLPEDEILARLVFGRGLDQISPFQALKLASAVATLSGRGGAGTIGRLRSGFGLDDLDVTTDAEGELNLRAGAYLSDNLYSDVTVDAQGQSEINLNLTVSPEVTVRGQVSSDGNTGIGIFFERDY